MALCEFSEQKKFWKKFFFHRVKELYGVPTKLGMEFQPNSVWSIPYVPKL